MTKELERLLRARVAMQLELDEQVAARRDAQRAVHDIRTELAGLDVAITKLVDPVDVADQ